MLFTLREGPLWGRQVDPATLPVRDGVAGAPSRLSSGQPGEQGPTFARFGYAVSQPRQKTAEWPSGGIRFTKLPSFTCTVGHSSTLSKTARTSSLCAKELAVARQLLGGEKALFICTFYCIVCQRAAPMIAPIQRRSPLTAAAHNGALQGACLTPDLRPTGTHGRGIASSTWHPGDSERESEKARLWHDFTISGCTDF